jgi:hypothetical protein
VLAVYNPVVKRKLRSKLRNDEGDQKKSKRSAEFVLFKLCGPSPPGQSVFNSGSGDRLGVALDQSSVGMPEIGLWLHSGIGTEAGRGDDYSSPRSNRAQAAEFLPFD